jgi:hypothetical protein
MNEAHQRFHDWLTAGAEGDPPRDVAVHASVCDECRRSIASLDLLANVNPGLAGIPAKPAGRERGGVAIAGRLVGATAVLSSAAIFGVVVSQFIGVSHANNDPVAQASPTPDQNVLGETATPQPSPEATPTPQETLTPLGTPGPTHLPAPVATPWPIWQPTPRPIATPIPTPVATPISTATAPSSATPVATPSVLPSETPVVTPTPTPTPSSSVAESVPPPASAAP